MVLQFERRVLRRESVPEAVERVIVSDVYGTLIQATRYGTNFPLMEFLVDAHRAGYDVLLATEKTSMAAARKAFEELVVRYAKNEVVQYFCQHIKMCAKEDMPVKSALLGFDNKDMRYMDFETPVMIDAHGQPEPSLDVLRAKYKIYSQAAGKTLSVRVPEV